MRIAIIMDKCRSCDASEFSIENHEKVCTNCGDVQENGTNLCSIPDKAASDDNFRNKEYEATQRLPGRIRGEARDASARRQVDRERMLDNMRKSIKLLIKDSSIVDETLALLKEVIESHNGRLLNSKKMGLVGACIYYLGSKHQLGITLIDISKVLGIKLKILNTCLKLVRELCPNFSFERQNIGDMVKKHIDQLSCYPLIETTDKPLLEKRVMLLIDLFEAMHPFSQPTPQILITAVIYHAWRSLDTFKMIATNIADGMQSTKNIDCTPHHMSYEKFCQICNIKYSSNGYKLVGKIQNTMLMLGKHLGDVNKLNLSWYLKDIIENSPHLIQAQKMSDTVRIDPPADQGQI